MHIPLNANPEFELFRRQSEGTKGFNLGHGNLSHFASTPGPRPKPDRRPTRPETPVSIPPRLRPSQNDGTPEWIDVDDGKGQSSNKNESKKDGLNLRVSTQFAISRIRGALNLCIPTTLLKRPSFTLDKLRDTFTNPEDQDKFSQWKSVQYIIVYDASSVDKKDALSSVNTLKKFATEGWSGKTYIVRGGFTDVAKNFPQLIDKKSTQEKPSKVNLSLGMNMAPDVAPVAGGCAMPAFKSAANPFFGNIRQNTDLIGGVGQMDVKLPEALAHVPLPAWLSKVADKEDHGKKLADKFLKLELTEKSRMEKALSSQVSYGTPGAESKRVQIAGIEKGGKNRYNNIWPFEHTRVKLQHDSNDACDYHRKDLFLLPLSALQTSTVHGQIAQRLVAEEPTPLLKVLLHQLLSHQTYRLQ
ncbi:putative Tyrosine-protein phosphatase 1 [Glarea lozoyensis 74030]|uniref:Putative Tyrosine-protein phosphatase 1 n=1 Tax=Glarea lozoyensis (strain ATCC 74030 / MF5533) TaxID=1104152 RepID=H0ELL6_GLAL7|nr:putative Tyrosine-protein phosphatase 1 [Glarea lozoyensis 74030]